VIQSNRRRVDVQIGVGQTPDDAADCGSSTYFSIMKGPSAPDWTAVDVHAASAEAGLSGIDVAFQVMKLEQYSATHDSCIG